MGKNSKAERQASLTDANPRKTDRWDHEHVRSPLVPKTDKQRVYLAALRVSTQIAVMGPAGTGKTYMAGTYAADQLLAKKISKIILVRPNVPSGRPLGFYPGTPEEKMEPWLKPLLSVIQKRMGLPFECARRNGQIEIVAFETMRGDTFENCIVILDEAQNTTPHEMKMFLTRIGENCKVIVNGDISQSDVKQTSGLFVMLEMIRKYDMDVSVVEFGLDDVVRSGPCEMWVKSFYQSGI